MDARPVKCRVARGAGLFHVIRVDPARIDPTKGRHNIESGLKNCADFFRVRHDRAVDDAVRFKRQERIHVASGGDPNRVSTDQLAYVFSVLRLAMDPASYEF